jgi:hypothetical protein
MVMGPALHCNKEPEPVNYTLGGSGDPSIGAGIVDCATYCTLHHYSAGFACRSAILAFALFGFAYAQSQDLQRSLIYV